MGRGLTPGGVARRYPGTRETGPMHASLRLGRVRGVEIGLNWSWLVIFWLIAWSLAASVFPDAEPGLGTAAYVAMALVGAALFFASLLLHELGHAIVAQREGMRIAGITLWLFGGVARFKGMFPSARSEFRIAIAGPLVSLAIGAGCLLVAQASRDFGRATSRAGAVSSVIGRLLMAGGIALLLVAGAVGGLWLTLIGWFVTAAARAETAYGVAHEALAGHRVSEVAVAEPVTVPAGFSVRRFADEIFERTRYAAYPVTEDGEVVGLLAAGDVLALPPARLDAAEVRDVMLLSADALVLDARADLAEATAELLGTSLGRALVRRDGELSGLVSLSDVERLLSRPGAREGEFRALSGAGAGRRDPAHR